MRLVPRRFGAIGTTLALLASVAVSLALFPGTANAMCDGSVERAAEFNPYGVPYVDEYAKAGTCNGNNYYDGYFRSLVTDWRASVWIQNNGVYEARYGSYSSLDWIEYDFRDNNSHSGLTFCIDNGYGFWICGWDSNAVAALEPKFDYSGLSTGF